MRCIYCNIGCLTILFGDFTIQFHVFEIFVQYLMLLHTLVTEAKLYMEVNTLINKSYTSGTNLGYNVS